MFGATNLTCGDWWAGTVMDRMRWVKCPAKTSQDLNILIMKKTGIGSHKSHMSRAGCLPARSEHAGAGRRPPIPRARARTGRICPRGGPRGRSRRVYGGFVGPVRDGCPVCHPRGDGDGSAGPAVGTAPRAGVDGAKARAVRGATVPRLEHRTRCRAFGRGQRANFAADGSGFRGNPGFPDYHGARAGQTRRTCK